MPDWNEFSGQFHRLGLGPLSLPLLSSWAVAGQADRGHGQAQGLTAVTELGHQGAATASSMWLVPEQVLEAPVWQC